MVACYGYSFLRVDAAGEGASSDGRDISGGCDDGSVASSSTLPPIIVKIIKALDYGSGQERGLRS